MGHAEDSVEAGFRVGKGSAVLDWELFLEPPLHPRVREGIVHLARMEMHFYDGILEDFRFALLVDNVVDGIASLAEGRNNLVPLSLDPEVNVAADAPFRLGVEVR